MHDLRFDARQDQEEADAATHARLKPAQAFAQLREQFGAAADAIDNPNERYSTRMDPADLRTVPPPDLRIPGARPLSDYGLRIDVRPVEAQIDAQARDLRTAGDKIADLTARLASVEDRLAALEARPLAMAEDAWSVGG